MIRVEVIANHSVDENILEAFAQEGVGKFYTKYPNVFGIGNSGPRMGDAVWPEENMTLVIWCEEDEARGIAHAVDEVKKQFPDEGIRVFGLPAQQSRFPQGAFYPGPGTGSVQGPGQDLGLGQEPAQPEVPVEPAASVPIYTVPPAGTVRPDAAPPLRPPLEPISPPPPRPAHTPPPVYSSPAAPLPGTAGPEIDTEYDGQNMGEDH